MAKCLDTIQTKRLILRGINDTDSEEIVKWRSDPEVYQYFKKPHKISIAEHIKWFHNRYLSDEARFDWMCIEKETGKKIGVVGLYVCGEEAEVNYILCPEARHKGYATEAIQDLIHYAGEKWGTKEVLAEIHKDNQKSIYLISKLGFTLSEDDGNYVIYRKQTVIGGSEVLL